MSIKFLESLVLRGKLTDYDTTINDHLCFS